MTDDTLVVLLLSQQICLWIHYLYLHEAKITIDINQAAKWNQFFKCIIRWNNLSKELSVSRHLHVWTSKFMLYLHKIPFVLFIGLCRVSKRIWRKKKKFSCYNLEILTFSHTHTHHMVLCRFWAMFSSGYVF